MTPTTPSGVSELKKEHDMRMAIMDYAAENNPDAVLAWIRGELASGKFLILPSTIYREAISLCKKAGWDEKELSNIHESKWLPIH